MARLKVKFVISSVTVPDKFSVNQIIKVQPVASQVGQKTVSGGQLRGSGLHIFHCQLLNKGMNAGG